MNRSTQIPTHRDGPAVARTTFLALALAALTASAARAQLPDPNLWVADGPVYATARQGNTLYIGGNFTCVAPPTGGLAVVDSTSGQVLGGWPRVTGVVRAVLADGSGGWYVGGSFTGIGALACASLAHLRADGSIDGWGSNANGSVYALALANGVLYVGGDFTSIGGQARVALAALDATTGAVTPWSPVFTGVDPYTAPGVYSLVTRGKLVYAGGTFGTVGGQYRGNAAAIDMASGAPTAWNPNTNGSVYALALLDGVVYAGGAFSTVASQARNCLAAIDTAGALMAWNPAPNSAVVALATGNGVVYAGGYFTTISAQARPYAAALDPSTGAATAWSPAPNGGVIAIVPGSGQVHLGGSFTALGGQVRRGAGSVDATSAAVTAWNPCVTGGTPSVYALAMGTGGIATGGGFNNAGGAVRANLAAIDLLTGRATAWNPGAGAVVNALAVSGDVVYAGGNFTTIGGQARNHIAALSASTGLATGWNPNANFSVNALLPGPGVVYAGGSYTQLGGLSRRYLTAIDSVTGVATAWNPNPSYAVDALARANGVIYVGGEFSSIGGQSRPYLAALDPVTGQATNWNPGADYSVFTIAPNGGTVYVGGDFSTIGGQSRRFVAALDATTGQARAWNPGANSSVYALVPAGGVVYAGGYFTSIGGQTRGYVAALDTTTAQATAWSPSLQGMVRSLVVDGGSVYTALYVSYGYFGLACFHTPPAAPPTSSVLSPRGGEHLRIGDTTTVMWAAQAPAPGVQSVDLYVWRGANGGWQLIAAGVPNTGRYAWKVTGPAVAQDAWLRVDARDGYLGTMGTAYSPAPFSIVEAGTTASVAGAEPRPEAALAPPAPNPAREGAVLAFTLARRGHVRLGLFDVAGREVVRITDDERESGHHTVALDARGVAPGTYFVRLLVPGASLARRITIVR